MARRSDLKIAKSGLDVLSHRILNDVGEALRAELLERAHIDVPGPSSKEQSGNNISVKMLFQGPLSDRDRDAIRDLMQKVSNPAELVYLLRKHGGS